MFVHYDLSKLGCGRPRSFMIKILLHKLLGAPAVLYDCICVYGSPILRFCDAIEEEAFGKGVLRDGEPCGISSCAIKLCALTCCQLRCPA